MDFGTGLTFPIGLGSGDFTAMARMRTIKPGFFLNEELYDLEKQTGLSVRVAFAGIWCQSDRDGRFEWRPRRLKSEILPYDDANFETILDALELAGFIRSYVVDNNRFGLVAKWHRHQKPHQSEPPSVIPPPPNELCQAAHFVRRDHTADIPDERRDNVVAGWGLDCGGLGLDCGGGSGAGGEDRAASAPSENWQDFAKEILTHNPQLPQWFASCCANHAMRFPNDFRWPEVPAEMADWWRTFKDSNAEEMDVASLWLAELPEEKKPKKRQDHRAMLKRRIQDQRKKSVMVQPVNGIPFVE